MKYILLIVVLGALLQYQQGFDGESGRTENASTDISQTNHSPESKKKKSGSTTGQEIVAYAKLFYGVPYQYGSCDPEVGFDCSGFISHVYTHFAIEVPRSSVDFTDLGTSIDVADAEEGDLVLFTGTDPESGVVGHIGIVIRNDDEGLEFIHSSSGKQYAVTISPLEGYYQDRFVKVIRVI